MKTRVLYRTVGKLHRLSKQGIPFDITFASYNETDGTSNGIVTKKKVMLRTGLSNRKYKKGRVLIGYKEYKTGNNGWFYLPLLLKVNNKPIYKDD
ncbi:MAG TPA: hypothetical protein VK050_06460 [Flavobacteriaceae bacterium]|nr:hypothetical protein [Flavobacteriaceae bacterium]